MRTPVCGAHLYVICGIEYYEFDHRISRYSCGCCHHGVSLENPNGATYCATTLHSDLEICLLIPANVVIYR